MRSLSLTRGLLLLLTSSLVLVACSSDDPPSAPPRGEKCVSRDEAWAAAQATGAELPDPLPDACPGAGDIASEPDFMSTIGAPATRIVDGREDGSQCCYIYIVPG